MKRYAGIFAAVGVVFALLALPRDSTWRIRAGKTRAVEEGIERLASDRFDTRERALRRLVSLGEAARAALAAARTSPNAEVRMRATVALRRLDRAEETPRERRIREYRALVEIGLRQPNGLRPGTQRFLVLSLSPGLAARVGAEAATAAEAKPLEHQRAVTLLADLARPEGAGYLASALEHGWWLPSTLHQIARGLVAAGDPAVVPLVRSAVKSDDPQTRKYAVQVLGRLGAASEAGVLRGAARDPEPDVRAEAAGALARTAGVGAEADLVDLASDPEPRVRAAALDALSDLPAPSGRRVSFSALSDGAPAVRAAGLRLLARCGSGEDAWAVRALLFDPCAEVRGAAIRALADLGLVRLAVSAGVADASPAVKREALLASRALPREERRELLARLPADLDPYLVSLRTSVLRAP
jgi:HEAT repeat protein